MKSYFSLSFMLFYGVLYGQDNYEKAQDHFDRGRLDSARIHIQKNLTRRPSSDDYFLSALIHEAEGQKLRAAADYEAAIQKNPENLEAYFQKGLIYYESSSFEQAIKDFTYVIKNQSGSTTNAIYFANDPHGSKGTHLSTLQSMEGTVYQYRGLAYQKLNKTDLALEDFTKALEISLTADSYVNRSQLYVLMGEDQRAIDDLKAAIELEPNNYLAWFNLAMIDATARLPEDLLADESFSPMLNLMGANAYESKEFSTSITYYSKALQNNPSDDLALVGRGKAYLKIEQYAKARRDFIFSLRINPERIESLFLIGNTFFCEKNFVDAIGFYDQYLSIDQGYENVWYNAAMAHLSLKNKSRACQCLTKANALGMSSAKTMMKKHCESQ